jgi:sugar phosphate permease
VNPLEHAAAEPPATAKSYQWLTTLVIGYIGVYLCRKNFSVAIPILQTEFHATHEQLGQIGSLSTVAYAAGKFIFGPVIDRYGGRLCLLASLLLVALFGAAGSLASTLPWLGVCYTANRLAGSASWGSMMKLVPQWFPRRQLAFAVAVLSLGFVFGGVCATLFAGQVAHWTGNNWRMVMGLPSAVLATIALCIALFLPRKTSPAAQLGKPSTRRFSGREFLELLRIRQFWIVCALSFTLTLLRETFNLWAVDFFRTEAGAEVSNRLAAFLATPFDALGALGIISLGWAFGRMTGPQRSRVLCVILSLLAVLVWVLPLSVRGGLWAPALLLGLIGFLTYGPYSLLAGVLSVEIRGPAYVGTVAGMVDGVGYVAGILSGSQFGRLVDEGGYQLGFKALAGLAVISAVLVLFLYPKGTPKRELQTEALHPSDQPA